MQNISNQISAIRKLGREFGLASYKRKDMIAQAVNCVKAAQKIAGASGFEAALDTLRSNFYETAFGAYLYPNEKESDRTLQAALSVIEKATKLYDSREKAAYDSVRSAWSAVRKACDIKDESRSAGATKRAEKEAAESEAVEPEAKPEAAKPVKVRTSKAFYEGFTMLIGQGQAYCDANDAILKNDARAKMIEEEFKKFAQSVNEIITKK